MYIVYILFMNHMHAGEWERAPGRTFTYNIQHTLICLFIIIEDVTHPSRYTGLQMQIFDKYLGNSEQGGDVVPLSISNLFDIDAGFIILVWTPIF